MRLAAAAGFVAGGGCEVLSGGWSAGRAPETSQAAGGTLLGRGGGGGSVPVIRSNLHVCAAGAVPLLLAVALVRAGGGWLLLRQWHAGGGEGSSRVGGIDSESHAAAAAFRGASRGVQSAFVRELRSCVAVFAASSAVPLRRAGAAGPRDLGSGSGAGAAHSSASKGGAGLAAALGSVGRACAAAREVVEGELRRAENELTGAAGGGLSGTSATVKGTGTAMGGAEGAGSMAMLPVAAIGLAMRQGIDVTSGMSGMGSLSGWAGAGAASGRHGLARGAGWMGPWNGAAASWLGEDALTHA